MLVPLSLIAFLTGQVPAQRPAPPPLKVTAELVGEGQYACNSGLEGYYVKLSVQNVSAASRRFLMYNCSWQECWSTDKSLLSLWSGPCRLNAIIAVALQPGQQMNFYGFLPVLTLGAAGKLLQKQKLPTYSTVRFAFTEVTTAAGFSPPQATANHPAGTVYWSNTVPVTFTDYQLLPPPAAYK